MTQTLPSWGVFHYQGVTGLGSGNFLEAKEEFGSKMKSNLLDNALKMSQNHLGCDGLTPDPCSPWSFLDSSSSQGCFQATFPKPHIQLLKQDFPNPSSARFHVQQLSFLVCSVPHPLLSHHWHRFPLQFTTWIWTFFANHIFPLSCFFSSSRKCETLGYWSAMFSNNNDEDWSHQAYWVYGIFEKVWHLFIYPKIPWNCRPLLPFFFLRECSIWFISFSSLLVLMIIMMMMIFLCCLPILLRGGGALLWGSFIPVVSYSLAKSPRAEGWETSFHVSHSKCVRKDTFLLKNTLSREKNLGFKLVQIHSGRVLVLLEVKWEFLEKQSFRLL